MCGGPVCISDSRDCIGLIEGIIPEQHEVIQARGMAAHIEADVISKYDFMSFFYVLWVVLIIGLRAVALLT